MKLSTTLLSTRQNSRVQTQKFANCPGCFLLKFVSEDKSKSFSSIKSSSGESFAGMKIGDTWHKFKDEVDLYLLLKGIVHRQTISTLKWRFKKFIEIIKRVKSYSDTEEYDKKSIVLKSQPPV